MSIIPLAPTMPTWLVIVAIPVNILLAYLVWPHPIAGAMCFLAGQLTEDAVNRLSKG